MHAANALAYHMGQHILLMNVVAPLLALALGRRSWKFSPTLSSGRALAGASAVQISLLWMAHIPAVMAWSATHPAAHAGMSALLLASAWLFWNGIVAQRGARRWRALVALLLTGKLFCLLAALLVFAPRALYPAGLHAPLDGGLADQQLAGLLMIAACPTTYVAAATLIAGLWLRDIGGWERAPAPSAAATRY